MIILTGFLQDEEEAECVGSLFTAVLTGYETEDGFEWSGDFLDCGGHLPIENIRVEADNAISFEYTTPVCELANVTAKYLLSFDPQNASRTGTSIMEDANGYRSVASIWCTVTCVDVTTVSSAHENMLAELGFLGDMPPFH